MEKWKRLYDMADRLKALKPWDFLYERQVFGVKDPETGITGFVSFMGSGGDHIAMTVYLGESALTKFFSLAENLLGLPPETILEIPQLQISFEDREFTEKKDRELIKSLGRKYSGRSAWPIFRSLRPGMLPWFMEDKEIRSMTHFLEQALEVASRMGVSEMLVESDKDQDTFLVRDFSLINGNPEWKDTFQKIFIPPATRISISISAKMMQDVLALPMGNGAVEADLFMSAAQIRPQGQRPYFAYMLLVIDKKSELVIGYEMLDPSQGLEIMYGTVPEKMLIVFMTNRYRPREIHIASNIMEELCACLSKEIKVPVMRKKTLAKLEMAKEEVMRYFQRQ
jgi:hypothetical protein